MTEINRMTTTPGPTVMRLITLLLISTLLLSCGGGENPDNGAGIAFQLKWPAAKFVGSVPAEIPTEVVTVRMSVSGPGMSTISNDFVASARTGSITNVPIGDSRTITFQGLRSDGIIIYQFDVTNVKLVQGINTLAPVTMEKVGFPAAPTSLNVTAASSSQINLVWVDNAKYESGYKIERKIGLDGSYALVGTATVNVTTYNDTALSGSTDYYYRVQATTNGIGDSAYSNEANVRTPVKTYSISGTITSGGSQLAGVTVTLTGGNSSTTTTNNAGNYSFSGVQDGGYTLTPGKAGYDFNPATLPVTVNGANLSAMSIAATANTVPTAPSGLNATATTASRISLAWMDNANNEGGYKIERAVPGGAYVQIGTSAANTTSYTDTALSALTTYYYRVRATNDLGDSGYTAEVNATTPNAATLVSPELVTVKGGTYTMGDTFGGGEEHELPIHQVTVRDFRIGKYEVTQGEWLAVMGNNPSSFKTCGADCPVENVSWNDIKIFIATLNQLSGKSYRLPTEAEWEYAARSGGEEELYSGGGEIGDVAWYAANSANTTHPLGLKRGNGLGIHDMSGNVAEWVNDWYGSTYYRSSPPTDPTGPTSGSYRVVRGGYWKGDAVKERTTHRTPVALDFRGYVLGFRLAVSVQ